MNNNVLLFIVYGNQRERERERFTVVCVRSSVCSNMLACVYVCLGVYACYKDVRAHLCVCVCVHAPSHPHHPCACVCVCVCVCVRARVYFLNFNITRRLPKTLRLVHFSIVVTIHNYNDILITRKDFDPIMYRLCTRHHSPTSVPSKFRQRTL